MLIAIFSPKIALATLYWYRSATTDGVCCGSSITGRVVGSVLIAQQGPRADIHLRKDLVSLLGPECNCKAAS